MSRIVSVALDPFDGDSSTTTSKPFLIRDAVDWSFSWNTTTGSVSTHTLQVSNHTASSDETTDIPESSWIDDVTFGTSGPGDVNHSSDIDQAVRWGRFLRVPTAPDGNIRVNKQVG